MSYPWLANIAAAVSLVIAAAAVVVGVRALIRGWQQQTLRLMTWLLVAMLGFGILRDVLDWQRPGWSVSSIVLFVSFVCCVALAVWGRRA